MSITLRLTRATCTTNEGITIADTQGVKFEICNHMGRIDFGDFCKVDDYVIAELVAEYDVTLISLGFYNSQVHGDTDFGSVCKEAAKAAGIEFVCTAG